MRGHIPSLRSLAQSPQDGEIVVRIDPRSELWQFIISEHWGDDIEEMEDVILRLLHERMELSAQGY